MTIFCSFTSLIRTTFLAVLLGFIGLAACDIWQSHITRTWHAEARARR